MFNNGTFMSTQMSANDEIRKLITTCKLLGYMLEHILTDTRQKQGMLLFLQNSLLEKLADLIMNRIVEN